MKRVGWIHMGTNMYSPMNLKWPLAAAWLGQMFALAHGGLLAEIFQCSILV